MKEKTILAFLSIWQLKLSVKSVETPFVLPVHLHLLRMGCPDFYQEQFH
jgi:hypothetical protein